jgi:hypothetical protein
MSRWTIQVDDVPQTQTIWDHILRTTDVRAAMHDVKPSVGASQAVIRVPHALDIDALRNAYLACEREVGELRGFTTASGHAAATGKAAAYVGFSLTWNPHHIDQLEPFYSTLGTPRNKAGEFFALARPNEQPVRKHSYWDAYGFSAVHPVIAKHFGAIFERFRLTPVRSRAATLRCAERERINSPEFMWHLDESPFCNLRLNIPLITAPEYLMEIDSEYRHPSMPQRVAGANVYWRGRLEVGQCYSWDTELAHRVFAEGAPSIDRVHLVFGFSPWFDFDPVAHAWQSNDFYGRVHPLDMAARGLFFRDMGPMDAQACSVDAQACSVDAQACFDDATAR